MRNLILFDDESWERLLPLTYTRPVSHLRIGALTIAQKWERALQGESSHLTQDYLAEKYPLRLSNDNYLINGAVLPNAQLVKLILGLELNEAIVDGEDLIATHVSDEALHRLISGSFDDEISGLLLQDTIFDKVDRPWKIFQLLDQEIRNDFETLTKGKQSAAISPTNRVLSAADVFVGEKVKMECCILNAEDGPIYLADGVKVLEGAILKGPLSVGEGTVIKMGAKIYGPSAFGPQCKIGGEVQNCAVFGYSNKAHDGYLGNSVLGEWCNIGADSNSSNLKNNYTDVRLWDFVEERFVSTGTQFCGLIMADHAKCGINTMFNTGTVVGVSANLYGAGFHKNFIPSFTWGEPGNLKTYKLEKATEVAEIVMGRREVKLTELDKSILSHIFSRSARFRSWEKVNA